MKIVIEDLGVSEYQAAYRRQLELVDQLSRGDREDDHCLIVEHPAVFTLGRNGSSEHVGVSETFLRQKNIDLIRIERGGEVTYHGPGQLVCYPIINLKRNRLTVASYIAILEDIMLDIAESFGVEAARDPQNHGIWKDGKKLGSVGIAIRKGVSFHGLALNINNNLEPFSWVNPCGLESVRMSSLSQIKGDTIDMEVAKGALIEAVARRLQKEVRREHQAQCTSQIKNGKRPRSSKPKWLKKSLPTGPEYEKTRRMIKDVRLNTVCSGARCPNQFECYGKGTATFMILGASCTRNCRFCAVTQSKGEPVDHEEPARIARAAKEMALEFVVLTSVTRDDLVDGGASQFAKCIRALKHELPGIPIEVLIPDFQGDRDALAAVCAEKPAVLNHNIETVSRLYPEVRPQALYQRSLELLHRVKALDSDIVTKSGLMVGLGEQLGELYETLSDLRLAGCDLLTVGQYLQPTRDHLPVAEFIHPEVFAEIEAKAHSLGFAGVAAGPHVRSSYRAGHLYNLAISSPVEEI